MASKTYRRQIVNGVTVGVRDWDGSGEHVKLFVRARSERQANKFMNKLGWTSYYRGPGQRYMEVDYYPRMGYIIATSGLDI